MRVGQAVERRGGARRARPRPGRKKARGFKTGSGGCFSNAPTREKFAAEEEGRDAVYEFTLYAKTEAG